LIKGVNQHIFRGVAASMLAAYYRNLINSF
jgi:hypothetical protein